MVRGKAAEQTPFDTAEAEPVKIGQDGNLARNATPAWEGKEKHEKKNSRVTF